MPQEWNNIIVVTSDELMPWFKSLDNLRKKVDRDKDKSHGIKKVQSGGNGRQLLIAYDSLPAEMRDSLGDPRKHHHHLELFFRFDAEIVKFYQEYQFEDGSYLSLAHQEKYTTNASVLRALLQMRQARITERQTKNGSLKGLMSTLLNDSETFNRTLITKHKVTHSLPSSEKHFKAALKNFEKNGCASLISKKHGNTNSKKVTDELLSLLNNLFAKQLHKPTRTEVSRQYEAFLGGYIEVINNETGELYDKSQFKPLTDASIVAWLGKWEHRIGTYSSRSAANNRQKLMAQFRPAHSMIQPKYAGSIISIDDRQPPFSYGDNKRVWFYNGIDLASECFTVFVHGKTKDGIILDFYRQMVRNYAEWGFNLPAELEAEMSLNSSFTTTFLREGNMFQKVHIEANNARAKRIERYFGSLRYGLEKNRIGWIARPFALSESNQADEEKAPIVPYQDIVNDCLKDLATWNNMPHSKNPEISRWNYFCQNQNPNLQPTNYKGILPYIGYNTPTSCNAGIIKLNHGEYLLGDKGQLYTGDKLIQLMKRVEDEALTIYWLDGNDGEVIKALVYVGDQYQCEAIAKPTYNRAFIEQTPEDRANREHMSAYVATIDAYMKDKKNQLERLVVVDNRVVTVNNDFKIPGLKQSPAVANSDDVEILEAAPDEFELPSDYTTSKSLADRF